MGLRTYLCGLAAACMLTPLPALADPLPGELSANVALTTNYVFRGISQTDDGPAIQGGFDYAQDIFYIGTWASSVDFVDDTTMELDLYAGLAPTYNDVTFDIGVIYYAYPDSPELPTGEQNFVEFHGGVSVPVGLVDLSAAVSYSPDFYGEIGGAFYYQFTAAVDLSEQTGVEGLSMSGGYGLSRFDNNMLGDDYDDWNAGVSASFFGLDFDLRYFDTTGLAGNDESIAFTISNTF